MVKVITPVTSPIPTIDTKIAANSVLGIVRIIFITKRIQPVSTAFLVMSVVARNENGIAKSTPSKVLSTDIWIVLIIGVISDGRYDQSG